MALKSPNIEIKRLIQQRLNHHSVNRIDNIKERRRPGGSTSPDREQRLHEEGLWSRWGRMVVLP